MSGLIFVSTFGTADPVVDARPWYDFSALVIASDLRAGISGVEGVDVASETGLVHLSVMTSKGRLDVTLPRRRASASNPHQLMVWTLITGVVMSLIATVFLRNQLRPIRQLARAAESFGRGEIRPYRLAGAAPKCALPAPRFLICAPVSSVRSNSAP